MVLWDEQIKSVKIIYYENVKMFFFYIIHKKCMFPKHMGSNRHNLLPTLYGTYKTKII